MFKEVVIGSTTYTCSSSAFGGLYLNSAEDGHTTPVFAFASRTDARLLVDLVTSVLNDGKEEQAPVPPSVPFNALMHLANHANTDSNWLAIDTDGPPFGEQERSIITFENEDQVRNFLRIFPSRLMPPAHQPQLQYKPVPDGKSVLSRDVLREINKAFDAGYVLGAEQAFVMKAEADEKLTSVAKAAAEALGIATDG